VPPSTPPLAAPALTAAPTTAPTTTQTTAPIAGVDREMQIRKLFMAVKTDCAVFYSTPYPPHV
jgi:hypothetical protein